MSLGMSQSLQQDIRARKGSTAVCVITLVSKHFNSFCGQKVWEGRSRWGVGVGGNEWTHVGYTSEISCFLRIILPSGNSSVPNT